MEIKLGRNVGLAGFQSPFTIASERFDLGRGRIAVSGDNVAGYSTSIPISDPAYRRRCPTHARARHTVNAEWHLFEIWDDWGTRYEILISDDEDGRALALKQIESLKANGLLPNPPEVKQ